MKLVRVLLITALLLPALPAQAAEEDWPAFGHALTLVHLFVRIAAESETPQQSLKAIDDVLLGRNPAANEAVKRNDVLAVELYIAGRGVDLASRDFWGRDALELARANGNARIADLLARNLPAGR